jgi:hypothetical protein
MSDLVNLLFIVGNLFLLMASLPLIYRAWRDRKTLYGYSMTGASLTILGLVTFNVAYVFMGNWISVVVNMPTVAYWVLAWSYSKEA